MKPLRPLRARCRHRTRLHRRRDRRRSQGRAERVAVGPQLVARRAVRQGHAGRGRLQARDQRPQGAAHRARRRLRPEHRGRNARKLVEEEKVDVLMGSSGVPATIAISQVGRESKTPMIGLSPISLAAGRKRLDRHRRAAAAADDRRGGAAHEARRREDRRLHRFHRRLGRPCLQLADEGGRAGRHQGRHATSVMRAPTPR